MALRFDAQVADLSNGARELGLDIPPLGSVGVGGLLVEHGGVVGIESLAIKSRGETPLKLDFEGRIQDLLSFKGVDVRIRMAVEDADLFRQFTKLSLAGVPVEAEFALEDADGSLGVSGEGELSRPGLFEVEVEGGFGDLLGRKDLDVRVGFETTTLDSILDAFTEKLSFRLPPLGPFEASGRLVLQHGSLGLKEIEVSIGDGEVMQGNLAGSVTDILAVRGVILDGRIQAKSASRIAALFDRPIPEVGPLDVAFSVRDADGSLGIESVSAQIGGGKTSSFSYRAFLTTFSNSGRGASKRL